MIKLFSKNLIFASIIVFLFVFLFARLVWGWTNPTANPPSGGGALYYNAGNVGIGTTDTSHANLTIRQSAASAYQLFLAQNNLGFGNGYLFRVDITDGDLAFVSNQGGVKSERMRLTLAGNVGIGTTAPQWKLDVVGGSMRADGYTGGGQLCIGSDCRASWPNGGSGFTGGGTTNYVPKWTGGTSLGNSTIFDDGTTVTLNSYNVRGATYSFGGMYVLNTPDSSCRRTNPFTGACSCPTNFVAGWASDGADFLSYFCYK